MNAKPRIPKLPPAIAYSLAVTNALLALLMLTNLIRRFEVPPVITWLTMLFAAGDLGLVSATFVWIKRSGDA